MVPLSLHQFRPQCFTLTITKTYSPMLPLLHYHLVYLLYCYTSFSKTHMQGYVMPLPKKFQCLSIKWVSWHDIKGLLQSDHILQFWPIVSSLPIHIASALSIGNVLFTPIHHILLLLPSHLFNYYSHQ